MITLIVFGIMGGSLVQSQVTSQQQPNKHRTVDSPVTIQGTIETKSERKPWWAMPEWWTVIVAAIAVFFAAGAFGAGLYQGIKAREALDEANERLATPRW
jgi:hypothetical protein